MKTTGLIAIILIAILTFCGCSTKSAGKLTQSESVLSTQSTTAQVVTTTADFTVKFTEITTNVNTPKEKTTAAKSTACPSTINLTVEQLIENKFYVTVTKGCKIINYKIADEANDVIIAKLKVDDSNISSIKRQIDKSYGELSQSVISNFKFSLNSSDNSWDIDDSNIEWAFEECHSYELTNYTFRDTGETAKSPFYSRGGRIYAIYAKAKNDAQKYLYLYRAH